MRLLTDSELRDARDSLERVIGITVADGITTAAKETGWQRVIDELVRLSTPKRATDG